jgi:hypoxanthine phosphoribosyltransferase
VNLLVDNIKKSRETLIVASKEVGLEVNVEKTKYMLSRHQTAGQNHDIKMANTTFDNVAQFNYLRTTAPNENCIKEKS